jgi:enoyl-CoA hydratase
VGDKNPAEAPVLCEVSDGVGRLVLNRPHVRNALDNEALEHIDSALGTLELAGCGAIVISGAADTFCAGSDIKALGANDASYQRLHLRMGQEIFRKIEMAPFLTVAAVAGYCLGGGVELALACDVRVAAEASVWGLPEVLLGAIPSWGGTQRLPRYVGIGRAKRMLLTGDRLTAGELAHSGLIDYVEPSPSGAIEQALAIAERVKLAPKQTFLLIKRLALASLDTPAQIGSLLEMLSDETTSGTIAELPRKTSSPG